MIGCTEIKAYASQTVKKACDGSSGKRASIFEDDRAREGGGS